ncbi:glycosyltransferase BC10-like [Phoenix dactylifera]|uniref:Glycosyltransferase BC10-like n=1 Tax=Phoenix dactylifera TaxID=42345 RepID=A0A8B7CAX5_PHODC|nr:glycosyltransferase BC10-like [Phoenix dactylifera]
MKPRRKGDEEEEELWANSPRKDALLRLIKIVTGVVVFMAGAVLGLSWGVRFNPHIAQTEIFFPTKPYAKECGKVTMNLKDFLEPCHLMHGMTDKELFWRASMVSKIKKYPFNRVPKVAFMFMTEGPLPFFPLWDRFFRGHQGLFTVYVHAYPGYTLKVPETSFFYDHQIPSEKTKRGSISLVDAQKRLLANALLDLSNERFVLLSESCIPVFNFQTIYNYLINSAYSFVQSNDENPIQGHGSYNSRMAPEIKHSQWREGTWWFEVKRSLAVNIVADNKYYSIFRKYCKITCYPDDSYIPTYLNMLDGILNANRTVTWADWSKRGHHPATYGSEDITEGLIQSIRNNGTICTYNSKPSSVCFLFAMKFSPDALEPLLNLASMVMKF